MSDQAKFKFNSGMLALVCSNCGKIIKTGYEFTKYEYKACRGERKLKAQYCDDCKPLKND